MGDIRLAFCFPSEAQALASNTAGGGNIALGAYAGLGVGTASNVICIGAIVARADVSNRCYIGSIFGQTSSSYLPSLGTNDQCLS